MSRHSRSKSPGVSIALLRGINVGGRNKLAMADLTRLFLDAGCERVQTYIQSGNVVFAATPECAGTLAGLISQQIVDRFGLRVPVLLRTPEELRRVIAELPFPRSMVEAACVHVAFLERASDPDRIGALEAKRSSDESFVVRGREVYLALPLGVGKTKLTNDCVESALGTTSTMRNWRTVKQLLALAQSPSTA